MNKRSRFFNTTVPVLVISLCLLSIASVAQKHPAPTPFLFEFEGTVLNPWVSVGNGIEFSQENAHTGKQSLEIQNATSAECYFKVVPNSTYRITAWVKTASGSDLVQLNVLGLGENNISVASARTDWVQLKKEFHVGEGQTLGAIEIVNPDNTVKNSVWADDIGVVRVSDYKEVKEAGIRSLPERIPKMDQGIRQQPNEKMNWFLDAKFGMFIHWGIYAGPAQGEWYMYNHGMRPEEYRKFAYPESGDQYFAADKFDAGAWAKLAKDAGMKYMCLTTMHHDGYALFDSKYMNAFSSKQTLNRDFVKEYVAACRNHGLKVGLYKTLINWRYPGYYDVTGTDCKPNKFGYTTDISHKENARLMKEELYCDIKQLMTQYGKIDQLFWDGGWLGQQRTDADAAYFWESGKYLDPDNEWPVNPYFQVDDEATGKPLGIMGMVRKYQPDVVVNARSGWYGDIKSEEGGQPVTGPIRSEDVWEKCMSMAPGWGYTPGHNDASKVISCGGVKRMLADCVVRNMVLLLNVGPDRHGKIADVEADVLRQTGQWLGQVGDAVYGTRGGPWNPKDGEYGFAYKNKTIYIYLLNGFNGKDFVLPAVNKDQKVVRAYSVTDGNAIAFKQKSDGETVLKKVEQSDKDVTILAVELNKSVIPEY